MSNELIEQKSWFKTNWKWILILTGIILISITIFFSSGMGRVSADLVQAYADNELYENAFEKVDVNEKVKELLGEIAPIDKMAILEGEVEYSNNNKTVNLTIRLIGTEGKARLDISADRVDEGWNYTKINVRIKNPAEKKQTIQIFGSK